MHRQRAVVHVAPVLQPVLPAIQRVEAVDGSVEPVLGLLRAVLCARFVGAGPLELEGHGEAAEQQVHGRLAVNAPARQADVARELAPVVVCACNASTGAGLHPATARQLVCRAHVRVVRRVPHFHEHVCAGLHPATARQLVCRAHVPVLWRVAHFHAHVCATRRVQARDPIAQQATARELVHARGPGFKPLTFYAHGALCVLQYVSFIKIQ